MFVFRPSLRTRRLRSACAARACSPAVAAALVVLPLAALGGEPAQPPLPVTEQVPVATYHLAGFSGGDRMWLTLTRVGRRIDGFTSCPGGECETTHYSGTVDKNDVTILKYQDVVDGKRATLDTLTLNLSRAPQVTGTEGEPDFLLPVDLHHDKRYATFPFRLVMTVHSENGVADMFKKAADHHQSCGDGPDAVVDRLDFYKGKQRVQSITGFGSESYCHDLQAPIIQDVNFDGHADILLREMNASARVKFFYWQYDPESGQFTRSNALDDLMSGWDPLEVDSITKTISKHWQSSGSTGYGTVYYTWKDGRLVVSESRSCYPDDTPAATVTCQTERGK